MKKNIIALLLAVAFVLSMAAFAGCAKTDTPTATEKPADKTEAPADGDATEAPKGDPIQLNWIMGYSKVPADQAMVEEKLDELSVAALNVKCHTKYMDNDTCQLAMQSGEEYDIVFTCEWYNNFAVQALAGYFADISDRYKTLTPDLYASVPEALWTAGMVGDALYAIPVVKDWAAMIYWRFDKKLAEDLKIDYTKYTDFASIEEALKIIKDAKIETAEYPLILAKAGPSLDANFDMINRDCAIGIPYSTVGTADVDTVVCTYFHKDYTDRLALMEKWYKAGYINPDANVLVDMPKYSAIKSGQGFYGADAIWTGNDGYEQVITMYSGPYYSTASARGAMNAISASSENQDAALKYMEYVCTNQEYTTMLRYGIEGYHWEKTAEGTAKVLEKGTNGYTPWAFSQGNYTVSIPASPSPLNMWDQVKKDMEKAVGTNGMGFAFDIKKVENEVAAVKGVIAQYRVDMEVGASDLATKLPELQAGLKTAGIEAILAECQTQFNAFLGK